MNIKKILRTRYLVAGLALLGVGMIVHAELSKGHRSGQDIEAAVDEQMERVLATLNGDSEEVQALLDWVTERDVRRRQELAASYAKILRAGEDKEQTYGRLLAATERAEKQEAAEAALLGKLLCRMLKPDTEDADIAACWQLEMVQRMKAPCERDSMPLRLKLLRKKAGLPKEEDLITFFCNTMEQEAIQRATRIRNTRQQALERVR